MSFRFMLFPVQNTKHERLWEYIGYCEIYSFQFSLQRKKTLGFARLSVHPNPVIGTSPRILSEFSTEKAYLVPLFTAYLGHKKTHHLLQRDYPPTHWNRLKRVKKLSGFYNEVSFLLSVLPHFQYYSMKGFWGFFWNPLLPNHLFFVTVLISTSEYNSGH
jgi:hypothetical protein